MLALGDSPSAYALEFTVTRFDDPEPNGCLPNDCSLREAIIATNSPAIGPDLINLPPGTYTLTRDGGAPSAAVGDLDIDDDLAIIGHGAATTIIDASELDDRIFDFVTSLVSPATIEGVTLRNGGVTSGDGGIIRNYGQLQLTDVVLEGGEATSGNGGAIASYGDGSDSLFLTLIRTTVRGSSAGQEGGGVYATTQLTITDSTISGNDAGGGGGGIAATQTNPAGDDATVTRTTISDNEATSGGGVQLLDGGNLLITNSTISNNTASDSGGGLNNTAGGDAVLASTTVTENHAGTGGGLNGDFIARNTIVSGNADNTANPDCYGNLTSEPANHIGVQGPNCNFSGDTASNTTGDAILGPLASNGGLTQTHALQPGSPAIDAGAEAGCTSATGGALSTDQRGGARHVGPRCDIGAYESGAVPPPTPTAIPTPEPTPTPTPRTTSTPGPTPAPTPVPSQLICSGPTIQMDGVATITATLTSGELPLAGFEVNWSDLPGLFSVSPDTSTTDAAGIAQTGYGVPADAGLEGDETVIATFAGNESYSPSGCEWTFHVVSSAFPTPSPPDALQGDVNCDKTVDTVDALGVLRDAAGFDQPQCIVQGDVDCDGDRDSVDALGILRHVAALLPLVQNEPCANIGTPL
jgi:hypothetical protein